MGSVCMSSLLVRMLSPYFFLTLSLLLSLQSVSEAQSSDPCYRENTNCWIGGELEIGHIPYFPDIASCEDACRVTDECQWFTWMELDHFPMCYLLKDCPKPDTDADSCISAKVEECQEKM